MAITAAAVITPPPLTSAEDIINIPPFPEQPQEDLTPTTDDQQSTTLQNPETLAPLPPPFVNSIAELKDLSAAIAAFHQCYDDLHNHLDSIKAAILSKLPSEIPDVVAPPSSPPRLDLSEERVNQEQHQQQEQEQDPPKSEIDALCKSMCSKGVRKYLLTHLSHLPKLREEVPKALKLAPNPLKLVLECLGKFFLQGSRAFSRNSPMIPAREASILILECYLLMLGTHEKDNGVLDIDNSVRKDAEASALAWQKRLVVEGGLARANRIDARGLLLFVASFGIPGSFKREDIRDLVIAANAKEIANVLKNSHLLMNKIPDIVEWMMKNKMEVNAVDIVYTFSLEERFNPQPVLVSFLRESKESWKRPKKGQGSSAAPPNEANRKHLAALKSVFKCLERHKIDPAKLLPGWQINEKIASLQRDISVNEKITSLQRDTFVSDRKSGEKTTQKRKASEAETSKRPKPQEAKRSRYPADHGPQQQKAAAGHVDSRRSMLDSRPPNHANNYSASPAVVYGGPGAGLLPESMIPSSVGGAGISANHAQYAGGLHGGVFVDMAGQVINRGAHPYTWHGDSAVVNERYGAQPSSVGLTSLYRGASTSIEGFGGLPNVSSVGLGLGSRSSGSDLYQFADSVAERESYPSTSIPRSADAAVPLLCLPMSQSYLYQV